MKQPKDPLVKILISAYRRGLAIKQNSQPAETAGTHPLTHNAPHGEQGIGNGGANDNSRNVPAKGQRNAGTTE